MKALIVKDIYTMSRQMRFYLLFILFFSCFTSTSSYTFAIVYAAMLPITALAYDERSKWANLALMMPYSIKDMVICKYVIGYGTMLLSAIISIVVGSGIRFVKGSSYSSDAGNMMLLGLAIGCMMLAVVLPLMFRFGVEKGRLLLFVVLGIIVGCMVGYKKVMEDREIMMLIPYNVLVAGIVACVILGTAVSVKLSEQFYKKQILG